MRFFAVLVTALSMPGIARAFELLRVDGNPCAAARNLFWQSATATVSVDPIAGTLEGDLVLGALDTWNGSVERFRFARGSGPRCNIDDRIAGVGFGTSNCDGEGLGNVLGITTSTFFTDSGELVDASVTFNSNSTLLDDEDIFQQTALHELGHVLGLDHSDACDQSGAGTLMRSVIIVGETRLTAPQGDDIDGANFVYSSPPEGTNSCAIGNRGDGGFAALSLLFAFAVLLRRRNREC